MRRSSVLWLSFCCLTFVLPVMAAQPPPDILKTDLMVVVAHPDDEGMVAGVMARYDLGEGKTTACIYATRGEGGGNAVGTQLGPALGQLREAELRECLSRVGVRHVYFLDKTDWAYTESAAATLEHWGHDDTLARLVRLVRNLRPEVLVTFLPAPTGGQHGHHQTTGLLATEAFDAAADPEAFPDQLRKEGLHLWQVKKLYYVYRGPESLQVATDGKAADGRSWAEIASKAESHHRSQGFGSFGGFRGPARPTSLTLVKSALPADVANDDLFAGLDAGHGLLMTLEPESYRLADGATGTLRLVLMNGTDAPLTDLRIAPQLGEGWRLANMDPAPPTALGPKERAVLRLTVKAPANLSARTPSLPLLPQPSASPGSEESTDGGRAEAPPEIPLSVRITASGPGGDAGGTAITRVEAGPDVEAQIVPLPGITRYRDWTRAQRIERFAGVLPSWVPVAAGQAATVRVRLTNRSPALHNASVHLNPPSGWRASPDLQEVTLPVNGGGEAEFQLTAPADAPVGDVTIAAEATEGSHPLATAAGTAQVTPYVEAPRLSRPPQIDGDLGDWAGEPQIVIPHTNLVQGQFRDDADGSAIAHVAYDEQNLYVGVRVRDDIVVSNIAPDDIKAHWRSDSIEVDVDPKPRSESTLTTFKMGVFPWDTAGHVRAERDADANQGPIEETAPGVKLASKRTEDGYIIEAAVPWSAIGAQPESGMRLGFNIIMFDGDQKDARIGDDINKGRLAWSFRPGIWGRPEQWGELRLQ